jgi:hypothetical protein
LRNTLNLIFCLIFETIPKIEDILETNEKLIPKFDCIFVTTSKKNNSMVNIIRDNYHWNITEFLILFYTCFQLFNH